MKGYLNFDKEEKGYEPFLLTKENVKKHIGRRICYVDYVEPYRGTYFVRYGTISSIRYSKIYFDDGNSEVDIRNIKEAGIQILKESNEN
jgi:hypothetical protein